MYGDLWVLTIREVRRWIRAPILALALIATPAAWILIFGYALNSALFTQQNPLSYFQGAPNYFNFIATGMIVGLPISSSVRTGSSMFSDRFTGYLSRLLVSPASRWTILYSKILGNALISTIQVFALILVTIPFGLDVSKLTPLSLLVIVGSIGLMTWGFSCLFIIISMRVRRPATQQIIVPLVTTPITFLSNVFYPASRMPAILRDIAALNPLTYTANIARGLFFESSAFTYQGFLTDLSILVAFVVLSAGTLSFVSKRWL